MYGSPESSGQEIVRTADIPETADPDRNDRGDRIKWAAGFIDADGSFGIYVQNKSRTWAGTYTLVLQSCQVNPAPLNELQDLFGGTVREVPGQGKRRDYFIWSIAGQVAYRAIAELGQYLVGKREEYEVAESFWARRASTMGREMTLDERDFYETSRLKMIDLKRRSYR